MARRDFLVEIGVEELPPRSLFTLLESFASGIVKSLDAANVAHGEVRTYATPRRLTVVVSAVADRQPDAEIRRQGPSLANAFDASGVPTRAAQGFAASCGVAVEQLEQAMARRVACCNMSAPGPAKERSTCFQLLSPASLDNLPIAKRMRWGGGEQQFVRPVHWVVMCSDLPL